MKLIIDSRENSELTERVIEKAQSLNVPFEKQWLEIGDYVFNDVCFEAKSSFDFIQSIVNKRLWNQLDNMDRAYVNNLVIVYGSFEDGFRKHLEHIKTNMNKTAQRVILRKKFFGSMGKIILDTDCSIIWVRDALTAAELIAVVCKMQPHDREVYIPRIVKQKKISTTDLRVDVLSTIKGVSDKKAKLLIKKFGSIMEIGEATPSELSEIEGIGNVLAKRIVDTLNSEEKMQI
jgi:Fanconi anemia group M protein|tara:strand:+ start:300 stop:998 length:699 start_codon:yes stop_codon:yes gene_type:complete